MAEAGEMAGAGVRIDVKWDDREVKAALRALSARLGNMRPVLDEIGQKLVTSVIRRFETERGPDGVEWEKSGRASRESGQTLTDTGRLRASITHRASRDEVVVGTNVLYAAIQQFGGKTLAHTIRPRDKKALFWPGAEHPVAKVNHPGSLIPARPFLGVDEGDREMILRVIHRALKGAMDAGAV